MTFKMAQFLGDHSQINELIPAFGGKLVGDDRTKKLVCETLLLMSPKVIDYVTKNCWFLSSTTDAWAYSFHGRDIPDKHLIFLSDELLKQREEQIQYTIAHEIGHVILGHRNSVGYRQTPGEIQKQEREADEFAQTCTKLDQGYMKEKMCSNF